MDTNNISRRAFVALAGSAGAAAAGAGLVGCNAAGGGNGSGNSESSAGVPATTPADKLPLPEKGKVYINEQPRDNIKDGGTLTLAISEIGPDWNKTSVNGNTAYMSTLWNKMAPLLWLWSPDGSEIKPNPDYVESCDVSEESGKEVVTIKVNPKAVFNDGTPMDVEAFKTAWMTGNGKDERFTPASTDGVELIESVEKGAGDHEVVITFSTPAYPPQAFIDVMHPANQDPEVYTKGWVNNPHNEWQAGPFVVDSFDDAHVTFKPNPQWWGDSPKLDEVTYKQMDAQATINAFKNGETDAAAAAYLEQLQNYSTMEDAEIRRAFADSLACYELNTTRGALQDIVVRKAFCQCFDPKIDLSISYKGVSWDEDRLGSIVMYPWQAGYENNLPDDVKKLDGASSEDRAKAARKTLEDAGYALDGDYYAKDGVQAAFSLDSFGDSATGKSLDAAVQKMAKDAGIKIDIKTHPASDFSKVVNSGDFDMIGIRWGGSPTGYDFGYQLYGSDSPSNFTHAGSPEADKLFNQVLGESDNKKQVELCNEAEKKALELYAIVPNQNGPDGVVVKKGLANYGPCLLQTLLPQNIGWQKEN